ncbi:hypothetical protein MKW94_014562 [Papaver nudicaule]|uniref:Las1-like family protein n=1 Tax=Papaver nudicaule TaxID=74823 RepID=A0AA41VC14_PAPNU|nr:hypothetical protein [Papaver nudicaule]
MEIGSPRIETEVEEEGKEYSLRLVPWLTWNDWNWVRESLFSSSRESINAALRKISGWRGRGCLPIAIEVTASIIEIQLKDPFFKLCDEAVDSDEVLSMLHCMSIVRLVNGVIEKTRKKTEVSIAEAANAIGIPRMLIDIRHESSHRNLPSLNMVRLASVKALDWLKSYYWESQKNSLPFNTDEGANVREEIKSKLHELACHLTTKQSSEPPSKKAKRSKKQVKRTLLVLGQLYSSFPMEVVAVMLEFLCLSGGDEVGPVDYSDISASATDVWKLMVTRFASNEPEFLLMILHKLLEMIGTREASAPEIGLYRFWPSQYKAENRLLEHLSSLVPWLIDRLKKGKGSSKIGSGDESRDPSMEVYHIPKEALKELLRKCLLVSYPGNTHLSDSAVLLGQMLGNKDLVKKLKKLSNLSLPSMASAEECSSLPGVEKILFEQEVSISEAAKKLELLKLRRAKGNSGSTSAMCASSTKENESMWKEADFWNACPIGMLPRVLGSTGVLPGLGLLPGLQIKMPEEQVTETSHKRQATCDVELLEINEAEDFKGYLMIGGVWKKVRQEEVRAIESDIRILV